jgi:excinuclease ABC subunit A
MPEGGGLEGEIDACGTPKEVAKVKGSYTRKFSRQVLK